ncbi:hypothetical protein GCK72_015783 [Caenorhabditis remanei]|uniref:ShKT domain-containing protein n=1 Tax=Caenorhabditis remanei TaxID=31234 RepID=A0A6A5GV16_CAERE|nr:hypothetical protein GCK72_015783 [Caenorhabditis remanei]KAF1759318.1 hypothetical protein GCK72_015783 [Caenorhabditis remanei]
MTRLVLIFAFLVVTVTSEECVDDMISCMSSSGLCTDMYFQSRCPYTCGLCHPDPTQCYDYNKDCDKFTSECGTVSDYTKSCPQTCGTCGSTTQPSCVDHSVNCPNYSNQCISDYLKELCPLSCNTCNTTTTTVTRGVRTTVIPIKTTVSTSTVQTTKTTTTVSPQTTKTTKIIPTTPKAPCKDASPNCGAWAKNGFCTNTFYPPEKRKEYCAKTCKFC